MDIEIRKSKISGKGVFAKRNFKKGDVVLNWTNSAKVVTKKELEKLSKKELQYVSFINGKYYLFKGPSRYFNHSCSTNAKAILKKDIAIRDIKKGEEITVSYFAENVLVRFECNCGSENCGGVVGIV